MWQPYPEMSTLEFPKISSKPNAFCMLPLSKLYHHLLPNTQVSQLLVHSVHEVFDPVRHYHQVQTIWQCQWCHWQQILALPARTLILGSALNNVMIKTYYSFLSISTMKPETKVFIIFLFYQTWDTFFIMITTWSWQWLLLDSASHFDPFWR